MLDATMVIHNSTAVVSLSFQEKSGIWKWKPCFFSPQFAVLPVLLLDPQNTDSLHSLHIEPPHMSPNLLCTCSS